MAFKTNWPNKKRSFKDNGKKRWIIWASLWLIWKDKYTSSNLRRNKNLKYSNSHCGYSKINSSSSYMYQSHLLSRKDESLKTSMI